MRFNNIHIYSTLLALTTGEPIGEVNKDSARMVIGYRAMSRAEAAAWNKENTPIRDDRFDQVTYQLGNGIYTSPSPGEWMSHVPSNWFCVIWTDKKSHKRTGKMWVPETYYEVPIWDEGETTVAEYVEAASHDEYDPQKTLRMSIVGTQRDKLQMMMIPKGLLGKDVNLKLTSQCKETVEELDAAESINYDDWHDNIQGSRTDPGLD